MNLKENEFLVAYVINYEFAGSKKNPNLCIVNVLCPYCGNIKRHGADKNELKDQTFIDLRCSGHKKSYCMKYDNKYINKKIIKNDTYRFINTLSSIIINKNTIYSLRDLNDLFWKYTNTNHYNNLRVSTTILKKHELVNFIDKNNIEIKHIQPEIFTYTC